MSLLNEGGNQGGNSGGAGAGDGNQGAGGTGAGGNGAGASGGSAGGGGAGGSTSWRDSLPEELRSDPSLQTFTDVSSLAKSYIHTKSQVGKKGVVVPGQNASDEEWSAFFKSIGQPDPDKYEVKIPEGKPIPAEFGAKFKEIAVKSGLLPKQAQGLMDWFASQQEESVAEFQKQHKTKVEQGIAELKKEWGDGWDKNLAAAKLAAKEAGILEHLNETGLGNDPKIIKALASFGKLYGEDKLRGEGGNMGGKTPAEIDKEIATIMGNPDHPYFKSNHPGHKHAVAEMEALFKAQASSKAG